MVFGFGDSLRVSPVGLMVTTLALLFAVYWTVGKDENEVLVQPRPLASAGKISLKSLLAASVEMAKLGGHEVRAVRQQIDIGEKSKGGAKNPVTEGDMKSHRVMYYGFKKTFPGLRVISEEDDPTPVDLAEIEAASLSDPEVDGVVAAQDDVEVPISDVDVWIDPLDATQEYTENLLQYVTTMVCVAVKGVPIIGVIHKPFENVTAWGWVGPNIISDALRQNLEDSSRVELSKSRLIVSRSHAGGVHDVAGKLFGPEVQVTPAGGAGYKSWEVALGHQDAYVHVTLIKKWDVCPGDALLAAMGGKMTTLNGEEIDYSGRPAKVKNMGGVLATLHHHDQFVEKLKDTLVTIK